MLEKDSVHCPVISAEERIEERMLRTKAVEAAFNIGTPMHSPGHECA